MEDSQSQFLAVVPTLNRGGKSVNLRPIINHIIQHVADLKTIFWLHEGTRFVDGVSRQVDHVYLMQEFDKKRLCDPVMVDSTHPLFVLYTSGSTGKPKGLVHGSGGYLVYAATTYYYIFNHQPINQIYWCTADLGWITGHTYGVYGPLSHGATSLMYEGVPTYPYIDRLWRLIDEFNVNVFYTAPTVIRMMMKQGDAHLSRTSRLSLGILGSVGEPINEEAWLWYFYQVGFSKSPVLDTWWQTETGGIMVTPLPGITDLKPGAATKGFFSIRPVILDPTAKVAEPNQHGALCISQPWPGLAQTLLRDHEGYGRIYFTPYPGHYYSGDQARQDDDGDIWITGRMDDVINVSGHRLSTAEIENVLGLHEWVAEAAVVGYPDELRGENIYAFVMLKDLSAHVAKEVVQSTLRLWVTQHIGALARPAYVQVCCTLPKTRSGKIMRRILRKILLDKMDELGDTSTLIDPTVVGEIYKNRLLPEVY